MVPPAGEIRRVRMLEDFGLPVCRSDREKRKIALAQRLSTNGRVFAAHAKIHLQGRIKAVRVPASSTDPGGSASPFWRGDHRASAIGRGNASIWKRLAPATSNGLTVLSGEGSRFTFFPIPQATKSLGCPQHTHHLHTAKRRWPKAGSFAGRAPLQFGDDHGW